MDYRKPTRVFDGVAARLPYLYYSVRTGMLGISIAALVIWGITGFNIVEGGVPLIAIQWSTFQTFALFFYLLMVNFQVGGLKNLKHLGEEIEYDLYFLGRSFIHPNKVLVEYDNDGVVDAVRASMISLLACVGCLFLFEDIWVPLYNYLQFGSLLWPVYFAVKGEAFISPYLERNLVDFFVPFFLALLVLWATIDERISDEKGTPKRIPFHRFKVKFRIDVYWFGILLLTYCAWLFWVFFPHSPINVFALDKSQVLGPMASTFNEGNCYVFPSQGFFPQNTYTFYPCSIYLKSYALPQILGFFDPDPWTHLVNVLTKYLTFLAALYPLMARVSRNEIDSASHASSDHP